MDIIGCLYLTTLACILIPPFIDRLLLKDDVLSLKRRLGAYSAMTLVYVFSSLLIQNAASEIIIPIIAVAIAFYIDRVTLLSTSFVLVLTSIFSPIFIVYQMTTANGIKNPLIWILKNLHWTFAAPLFAGIISFLVFRHLTRRSRGTRHETPRPLA
jgi:hypothetical protein